MWESFAFICLALIFYDTVRGQIKKIDIGNEANEPLFRLVSKGFDSSKPNLTVPFLTMHGGYIFPLGDQCQVSAQLAIDRISKQNLLKNYNLIIDMFDEQCNAALGIRLTVEIMEKAKSKYGTVPPFLIGPGCIDAPTVGHLVKHYDFVVATEHVPNTEMFKNRQMYSNAFVFSPSLSSLFATVPYFIKENGWNRVFLLSDSLSIWSQVSFSFVNVTIFISKFLSKFEKDLNNGFAMLNISMAGVSKFPYESGKPTNLEYMDKAVGELAAMDNPRVIVVFTIFKSTMACFLFKHGLYGPDIVLLWPGDGYFTEKDNPGVPNCNQRMVTEVLKSVIFFSDGSDFTLGKPVKDSLGLYPFEYERYLKANLEKPEESWKWFFWRRYCYSPIEATAHVLQKVDERLGLANDTIGNWMANSENFRRNPGFIETIMKEVLNDFEYEGLRTNTLMGPAGFFQMQQNSESGLKPVPVAAFNPSSGKYEILAPLQWLTANGDAPWDRIHFVNIHEPLVKRHTIGILIGILVYFSINNF